MTLAFELAALRQARDPQAVVVDARRWARNVGLLSADPAAADAFCAEHLVRRDFRARPTAWDLQDLSTQFETERYVLIGTTPDRPAYLLRQRWEYLRLADAASAAGWNLGNSETRSGRWLTAWLNQVLRIRD
ncbi:DUF7124 domain-containing protein [Halococcus hamelinensis]|uniref:DUF7124 domain-containing protein n=1 Tax=Halococcus hamelinensis 100A6 TaxID=1132509 RepID=M0M8W4_9EURY|nr:hypothetical protein [Halococcus hamelinensis]EMA42242.1 hypothetical protein C447_00055 [Halococcus hamelinensis 100A6]